MATNSVGVVASLVVGDVVVLGCRSRLDMFIGGAPRGWLLLDV